MSLDTSAATRPTGGPLLARAGRLPARGRWLLGGAGLAVALWLPNGIFIAPNDRIYVADAYNRRIAIFEPVEGAAEVKP